MRHNTNKTTKPLVSIICITYNHEQFIAQTLEGFTSQKTNFGYEIIIHDDASTDNTPQIIKKYAKEYPGVFVTLLEKENRYSKGDYAFVEEMFAMARGKYIAMCEGDDYWVDPIKLQRQVDFMEKHPDYALVFHPVKVFFENNEEPPSIYPTEKHASHFTTNELLRRNFIQTNSVMYRRQNYQTMSKNIVPGDWYLHLYHAQFGKIGFINEVMSVYRRHSGGTWWNSYKNLGAMWQKHGLAHLNFYKEITKIYGQNPEHKRTIKATTNHLFNSFLELDAQLAQKLLLQAIKYYPEDISNFIRNQHQELKEKTKTLESQGKELAGLRQNVMQTSQLLDDAQHNIRLIKASRLWKLRNKISKLMGRPVV